LENIGEQFHRTSTELEFCHSTPSVMLINWALHV